MSPARLLTILAVLSLTACDAATRISEIGRAPAMAPMENPTAAPGWRQISMPMPPVQPPSAEGNSLWRQGSRTFLRDQRAAQVGDLVTILVQIADRAKLENTTERSRANTENVGIPSIFGLQTRLPAGVEGGKVLGLESGNTTRGDGAIDRNETVTLRVAATVVQMLPNGNLVVAGRQQVRVNHELRELQVSGIARPADIGSDNTVKHDRLAEARISYGGRGTISDVQTPRYGQELLDIILPF